jgi:hypothetical protein
LESWVWGLLLIALTMAIHGTGLVLVALLLEGFLFAGVRDRLTSRNVAITIVEVVATVGLLLALLHVFEAGLWAVAYWWLGALKSLGDALLYSVDCISTRGSSGVTLPAKWQLMGALEAVDGMLLFGISTAFIFAIAQDYWSTIKARRKP